MIASVVAFAVLLDPLGYVLATRHLLLRHRRHPRRPALRPTGRRIAVALSVAIYLAFTQGLGIYLPPGLLDGIL